MPRPSTSSAADEVERLEVKSQFLEGTLLRVLHAFVPVDCRDDVIRRAFELTGGRLSVEDLPLGPRLEEVPVVLSNPAFAKPFEILLRVFPPPTYGTIDPTVINAVGVPLFFGLIVGDVAYGLIILAVAIWLRHRYRQHEMIHAAGTVGIYCAASAVLFGLLYGELFGGLGMYLGLRPVLHREDPRQLILLLKLVVCLGAAHVAMGLLLGILSARRILDRHAFCERLGQMFCLAGLLLAVAGLMSGWPGSLVGAAGLFLTGVVVLLRSGAGGTDRGLQPGQQHPVLLASDGIGSGLRGPGHGCQPAVRGTQLRACRPDGSFDAPRDERADHHVQPHDSHFATALCRVFHEVLPARRENVRPLRQPCRILMRGGRPWEPGSEGMRCDSIWVS